MRRSGRWQQPDPEGLRASVRTSDFLLSEVGTPGGLGDMQWDVLKFLEAPSYSQVENRLKGVKSGGRRLVRRFPPYSRPAVVAWSRVTAVEVERSDQIWDLL